MPPPFMSMHTREGPVSPREGPGPEERQGGPRLSMRRFGGSFKSMVTRSASPPAKVASAPAQEPCQHDAFEVVVCELCSVANSPHNGAVVALGFATPLINLLRPEMNTDVAVQLLAARALSYLASRRDNRKALYEAGLLSVLLSALERPALANAALEILRPLARMQDIREQLGQSGVLRTLVKLLHVEAERDAATPTSPATVENALAVIRNLAASPVNQESFRSVGAVRALSVVLDVLPRSSHAAAFATTALSNLAVGNQANKNAIRLAGAIPKIVLLLGDSGAASVAAVEALGNLAAKNDKNKDAIREAGGVKALAELLRVASGAGRTKGGGAANSGTSSATNSRSTSPANSRSTSPPVSNSTSKSNSRCNSRSVSPQSRSASPQSRSASPRTSNAPTPVHASHLDASAKPPSPPSVVDPLPITSSITFPPPPDTSRQSGACSSPRVEPSAERLAWALRNTSASNGLNTAIIAASGLTLKDIEGRRGETSALIKAAGDKMTAPPMPSPRVPPPRQPATLPLPSVGACHEDERGPSEPNVGCVGAGVGLTMWSKTGRSI